MLVSRVWVVVALLAVASLDAQTTKRPAPKAPARKVAPPPAPPLEHLGDFHILREIGHGGMGVVYEAEQQSPRRPVALKVIRGGELVDAQQLKLF